MKINAKLFMDTLSQHVKRDPETLMQEGGCSQVVKDRFWQGSPWRAFKALFCRR